MIIICLLLLNFVNAKFPPATDLEKFPLSKHINLSRVFYEIQLVNSDRENIYHVSNLNGDRLRAGLKKAITMQLFIVNNGYVFKYHNYKDILCLNSKNMFRMLTRPATTRLPEDCVIYFELLSDFVVTNKTLAYVLNEDGNNLCVLSDIHPDCRFRLYALTKKNEKIYLKITNTSMVSTQYIKSASIFGAQYESCLSSNTAGLGSFVCYLVEKKWPCDKGLYFDKQINIWRQNIINLIRNETSKEAANNLFEQLKLNVTEEKLHTEKLDMVIQNTTIITFKNLENHETFSWFEFLIPNKASNLHVYFKFVILYYISLGMLL